MRLEFIDIPNVHTLTDEIAHEVMGALANTEDLEIFDQKVVRKLIEFKWPIVREYTIKKLFIPFVGFLFTYFVFMNFIYYMRFDHLAGLILYYICLGPLTGFALYFIFLEMKQLAKTGLPYLTSFWNYLDLIPPLLLLVFIPLALLGEFDRVTEKDPNDPS